MEVALRKNRDTVFIVGTGTLILSIWGVFKAFALMILSRSRLEYLVGGLPEDVPPRLKYPFMWFLIILDFLLRFIIGYCARREGEGKKQGILYIFLSMLLIFLCLSTIIERFGGIIDGSGDPLDYIVMNLIDGTSMVVLVELVISAIRVKLLTRMLEKGKMSADKKYAA